MNSIKTASNACLTSADSYDFIRPVVSHWPASPPDRCYSCAMTEDTPTPAPDPALQPRNPLHGVTLEAMVTALADYFGWQGLGERIPVRCFQSDHAARPAPLCRRHRVVGAFAPGDKTLNHGDMLCCQ